MGDGDKGAPLTIQDPGVSIKPYPSGILTHQSMDAMLKLVLDHDLKGEEVERIRFFAGFIFNECFVCCVINL